MLDIYDVVKRPLVTEKSMGHLESENTYVFEVHPRANKVQIRNAIERLFDVKVVGVRTARVPGKPKRRGRELIRTPAWKKAFVKLAEENVIELF